MIPCLHINQRSIGPGAPVYMIAEMSANHRQDYDEAVRILHAACQAGADAVKLQTYTPDTMTLDCDEPPFTIQGTIWNGRTLYDLYQEAYTPWAWHEPLQKEAQSLGIDLFSTPFDFTAVDFLEDLSMPAYKIASFENTDLPLIRKVASTGKPVILSTGMATQEELDESVEAFRMAGGRELALLKCTSAYPSPPSSMNLKTLPLLAERYHVPAGLSDHTLGIVSAVASVALGACIIEKHFILSREAGGPDSTFSLEPEEFKQLVQSVRDAEAALGEARFACAEQEKTSRALRRSLFASRTIQAGETLSSDNIRVLRPGDGLAPKYYDQVLGCTAARAIQRGEPLRWEMVRETTSP